MNSSTLRSPLPCGETVLDNFSTLEQVVWTEIKAECKQTHDKLYSSHFFTTQTLLLTRILFMILGLFFIYPKAASLTSQRLISSSDMSNRFFAGAELSLVATISFLFYLGMSFMPDLLFLILKKNPRFDKWLLYFRSYIWFPLYLGLLQVSFHVEPALTLKFFINNWSAFVVTAAQVGSVFLLIAFGFSVILILFLGALLYQFINSTFLLFLISLKLPKKYDPKSKKEVRREQIPTHGDLIMKVSKIIQPLVKDWPKTHWEPLKELAAQREEALNTQVQFTSFWFIPLALLSLLPTFIPEVFDTMFEQAGSYLQYLSPDTPGDFLQWMTILLFILLILMGTYYFIQAYKQAHVLEIIKALCTLAENNSPKNTSQDKQNLLSLNLVTDNQSQPITQLSRISLSLGALSLVSWLILLLHKLRKT